MSVGNFALSDFVILSLARDLEYSDLADMAVLHEEKAFVFFGCLE